VLAWELSGGYSNKRDAEGGMGSGVIIRIRRNRNLQVSVENSRPCTFFLTRMTWGDEKGKSEGDF
jgi:hypothetical protein